MADKQPSLQSESSNSGSKEPGYETIPGYKKNKNKLLDPDDFADEGNPRDDQNTADVPYIRKTSTDSNAAREEEEKRRKKLQEEEAEEQRQDMLAEDILSR